MTREELKEHCKKEIEMCEFWAHGKDEELNGNKIYQEHKLILKLLEQGDILDKLRAEIKLHQSDYDVRGTDYDRIAWKVFNSCLQIIDKYKSESEVEDGNN